MKKIVEREIDSDSRVSLKLLTSIIAENFILKLVTLREIFVEVTNFNSKIGGKTCFFNISQTWDSSIFVIFDYYLQFHLPD